jgi:hypothetical protein
MEFKGYNLDLNKDEKPEKDETDPEENLSEETKAWVNNLRKENKKLDKKERLGMVGAAALIATTVGSIVFMHEKATERQNEYNKQRTGLEQILKYITRDPKLSGLGKEKALLKIKKVESSGIDDGFFYEILWKEKNTSSIKNQIGTIPRIEGFNSMGIDQKLLLPIFDPSLYPSEFMNGNITSIGYSETYGKDSNAAAYTDENNNIVFFRRTLGSFNTNDQSEMRDFLISLVHEGSHASDWEHKMNLTIEQRIEFFADSLEVFDKYRKYEVDPQFETSVEENALGSIKEEGKSKNINDKENRKIIKRFMITEWWAKLCTGYLEFPNVFEVAASNEEKALIKQWLVGGNKSFNSRNAYVERNKRWKKIHDQNYKILKDKNLDSDAGFRRKNSAK